MPDDERIQLMLKVKEGSITMEDALDKVCRIVQSQLVLQIALKSARIQNEFDP